MHLRLLSSLLLISLHVVVSDAQTNMRFSSADLTRVFAGNYLPEEYGMQTDYGTPEDLVAYIHSAVSADSLKSYLVQMQQFETRNSGSDTLSSTRGIGAARNWMQSQFARFSATNDNRLLTGSFFLTTISAVSCSIRILLPCFPVLIPEQE